MCRVQRETGYQIAIHFHNGQYIGTYASSYTDGMPGAFSYYPKDEEDTAVYYPWTEIHKLVIRRL